MQSRCRCDKDYHIIDFYDTVSVWHLDFTFVGNAAYDHIFLKIKIFERDAYNRRVFSYLELKCLDTIVIKPV